ncbi:MAG: FtsQ-type POTRA domain-containing protein, partial [Pseudomonadota bacterium]
LDGGGCELQSLIAFFDSPVPRAQRGLRRFARYLRRAAAGDVAPIRGFGWPSVGAFFGSIFIYGSVAGPGAASVVDRMASASGFGVELHLSGNQHTSAIELHTSLGKQALGSLAGLNIEQARQTVEALPWVERAVVRKYFPGRLDVSVTERAPFAVWQRGAELLVVERSGSIIAPLPPGSFTELPLIVGAGAERRSAIFLKQMDQFPALKRKVGAFVRVAERRWDLHLKNGVRVLLPADDQERALIEIAELDSLYGLLERDVELVDFRVPDRISLRLTEGANERRVAAIEERAAAVNKRLKARGARL